MFIQAGYLASFEHALNGNKGILNVYSQYQREYNYSYSFCNWNINSIQFNSWIYKTQMSIVHLVSNIE